MANITTEVTKDGVLILKCDLTKSFGPSKSGKTIVIGTTSGNIKLMGPKGMVSIGVNVYREPKPEDKAPTMPTLGL